MAWARIYGHLSSFADEELLHGTSSSVPWQNGPLRRTITKRIHIHTQVGKHNISYRGAKDHAAKTGLVIYSPLRNYEEGKNWSRRNSFGQLTTRHWKCYFCHVVNEGINFYIMIIFYASPVSPSFLIPKISSRIVCSILISLSFA